MLTNVEQLLFASLCIFQSGFTREAALTIGQADASMLDSWSRQALLQYNMDTDRYHIHELVHQYGQEQLFSLHNKLMKLKNLYVGEILTKRQKT